LWQRGRGIRNPNLGAEGDIMSGPGETPESSAGGATANAEADDALSNEGLASLLLRLLGIYFLGWAIITGVEEAVRLLVAISTYSPEKILAGHWTNIGYIVAEFAVGGYLLFGAQWVLEKVLLPVAPHPPNDDRTDEVHVAPGDQPPTEKPPGTTMK
jgi:hypothetical protein